MAMKVLSSAPSAMTGMGGHLMLGYQKSVTTPTDCHARG